jgi:hypothetical protein
MHIICGSCSAAWFLGIPCLCPVGVQLCLPLESWLSADHYKRERRRRRGDGGSLRRNRNGEGEKKKGGGEGGGRRGVEEEVAQEEGALKFSRIVAPSTTLHMYQGHVPQTHMIPAACGQRNGATANAGPGAREMQPRSSDVHTSVTKTNGCASPVA